MFRSQVIVCFISLSPENVLLLLLVAILGDQQSALFGQCCFSSGEVKCTYGTGAFLLMCTGKELVPSTHGLLTTVAYKLKSEEVVYALEGSVQYCGSIVQWLRDNLQLLTSNSESEEVARQVEDNGGVYFVPAFAGLGAPHWDESARGMVIGLTAFNNKSHLVRSALEAAAFLVKQVLDTMKEDFYLNIESLYVDGGMTLNDLFMQFQADLLDVTVNRPVVNETTALGVALAAGLGVGLFKSISEIRSVRKCGKTWSPTTEGVDATSKYYSKWQRAVERCGMWEQDC